MENTVHVSNWNECYVLLNPALAVDVNNSIKIQKLKIESAYSDIYPKEIEKALGYTLTDDELIILYWAKKCRSLSFIQKQLQIDRNAFEQVIKNLQNLGILSITNANPADLRVQHYLAYNEYLEAPEDLNLIYQWKRTVSKFADNTYILDKNDNTTYTYREFGEIVNYVASTLIQCKIGKGDKIILHADINFEAIALFWACMHLGIVFMPVNSSLAETVIEGLIVKYDPKAIFLSHEAGFREDCNSKIVFFDDHDGAGSKYTDRLFFSEWLSEGGEIENIPVINENDLAVILHTSGSTGIPKGVKLAHGQLFQSAINVVNHFNWDEKYKYLGTNDLDSIAGLRGATATAIEAGGTCVIPALADKSNPGGLLRCIYESGVTYLSTGPALLNQFLNKTDLKSQLANVSCIMSAGSALTSQLKTGFFEKTGKRISNVYGLTETGGIAIGERSDSTELTGNYIGFPVDCLTKIIDDDNQAVKVGQTGELLLYGYTVFKGYYSENEPTPNETQQWFITGDLVQMNPDGSIELTGRKKDFMKNARGEIIYFNEIEEAIAPLTFIKDLGVIAFFKNEAERGALFVVLDGSVPLPKNVVEEVKTELTAKLGHNKIPSVIKIIEKIPRNKYGKLLKTELSQYL